MRKPLLIAGVVLAMVALTMVAVTIFIVLDNWGVTASSPVSRVLSSLGVTPNAVIVCGLILFAAAGVKAATNDSGWHVRYYRIIRGGRSPGHARDATNLR